MSSIPNITDANQFMSVVLTTGEAFTQKGAMAYIKSDGLAYNATATITGGRVYGMAFDAYASGAPGVFRKGNYRYYNSTSHPVTAAHLGAVCEVEDNFTVCASGTSTMTHPVVAGTVVSIDSNFVTIDIGVDKSIVASAS